jgi:hypothetical protein
LHGPALHPISSKAHKHPPGIDGSGNSPNLQIVRQEAGLPGDGSSSLLHTQSSSVLSAQRQPSG